MFFAKAAQIAATQPLHIVSMERREALAQKRFTLEGEPAILIGMEEVKPALLIARTGLVQPMGWDQLERRSDFFISRHYKTTSYFAY
jgi:hypothetical protein